MGVREQLSELANRLQEFDSVPQRAVAFHSLRLGLLEQIRNQEGSWMPWQRQESHRLLKEGRDLTQLADALAALLGECNSLIQRADHVDMLANTCPDPVLAQVTRDRTRVWKTALESLGTSAGRPDDLAADWDQVQQVKSQIDASARFIPLFAEAVSIEERLKNAGNLGAAVVAADIERWRREYVTHPPSPDRAEEGERVLNEHRGRLVSIGAEPAPPPPPPPVISRPPEPRQPEPQPPTPPPVPRLSGSGHAEPAAERSPSISLFAVSQLLRECRDWSDADTGDITVVRPLQERYRHLNESPAKDPAEIERLGADAAALRDRLRDHVQQKAAAERARMETRIRLFDEVCGKHGELSQRLSALLRLSYETADDYHHFAEALRQTSEYFLGVANIDQARLNQGVAVRGQALRTKVAAQKKQKRTRKSDRALDVIENQIPAPSDPPPLAGVSLDALEQCERLDNAVRELSATCAQDIRALELERDQLALRIRKLVEAGGWTEVDASGLSTLENNLVQVSQWPENAIIDDCREELHALSAQVERYDDMIRAAASELLRNARSEFAAARRELSLLNRESGADLVLPADPPEDLSALVTVLANVREHQRSLGGLLESAEKDLRDKIPVLKTRLDGVLADADFEQQANRVIADDMLAELQHLPAATDPVVCTPESVAALRRWVRQCDDFFYSLERERLQILDDARALRERALLIRREGRHEYRPALHERALALIEGVEPLPASLDVARHQLERAKELLEAIERDSLRLLVQSVRDSREALKREVASSRDPGFVQRARSLLEELDSLGDDEIVPAATRRSLFLLTGRGHGGIRR